MRNCILAFVTLYCLTSYGQLEIPPQSSFARINQRIGLTDVVITYSRPNARERSIFGEDGLLPNGEFWRVGANAATKISFSSDVMIGDKVLEEGSYTILAKPHDTTWTLNWYIYDSTNWNSYIKDEPVLIQKLPVHKMDTYVETMELHFQNVTIDSSVLLMEWENTRLKIRISVDEEQEILNSIASTMTGPNSFDYYQAALYLHETKIDLDQALMYIQKITATDTALFFQVTREALILRDLKRNKEAIKSAKRALILSRKADNNDFIRINKKIIEGYNY